MGERALGPVPCGHPTSLSPHMWKEIDEAVGGYMAEIKAVGPSLNLKIKGKSAGSVRSRCQKQ